MPDPYNLSGGQMIGTPVYSPRSQVALRKLRRFGGADVSYGDESDVAGLDAYLKENPDMTAPVQHIGHGMATIGGKTYVMGEGGSAQEVPVFDGIRMQQGDMEIPEVGWQERRRYDARGIKNSDAYAAWVANKNKDNDLRRQNESAKNAMALRLEEARKLREMQTDPTLMTPADKVAAAQAAALQAQAEKMGANIKKTVEDYAVNMPQSAGYGVIIPKAKRYEAMGLTAGEALARASQEAQVEAAQVQAKLAELAADARKGDKRSADAYLSVSLAAKQKYGDLLDLSGTPSGADLGKVAEATTLSQLGPDVTANLDMLLKPLVERDAQAYYQRSGPLGGAFTRNTADYLSPEELQSAKQEVADYVQQIAAKTGMPVDRVARLVQQRIATMTRSSGYQGTSIKPDRAEEIIAALRGQ